MVVVATYVSGCLILLCKHVLISVCIYIYVVVLYAILPRITHILFIWTISVLMSQRKQFIRVNRMPYIAHTLIWLTVSFVLPNHKQFIRVNRMLYIAHTFIWLPVSFAPPHCRWLIELNRMPCIAHATKIWTVFDGSAIANVLHLFWQFFYTTVCDYCIAQSFGKGSLIVVLR